MLEKIKQYNIGIADLDLTTNFYNNLDREAIINMLKTDYNMEIEKTGCTDIETGIILENTHWTG